MSANKSARPFLSFRLAQQHYALAVANVLEVAAILTVEELPDASEAFLGVANRHGEILPILDLRKAFNLEASAINVSTFFIVAEAAEQRLGLVVDEIYQVEYFEETALKTASGTSRFISHLVSDGEKLYQVLNLKTFLAAYLSNQAS